MKVVASDTEGRIQRVEYSIRDRLPVSALLVRMVVLFLLIYLHILIPDAWMQAWAFGSSAPDSCNSGLHEAITRYHRSALGVTWLPGYLVSLSAHGS